MTRAALLAVIVVAGVITASVVWPRGDAGRERTHAGRAAGAASALPVAEEATDDTQPPALAAVTIAGRVVDPIGRPVPGAHI
ncbi:MAG: hypothetical protein ACYTDU_19465, partial [Planctomycetota bacterium]